MHELATSSVFANNYERCRPYRFRVQPQPPTQTLDKLGLAGTTQGKLGISGVTSGVVTLAVAATAGTWTMTLPAAVGTAGYFLVDAAGNGVTSWSNTFVGIAT